MSKTKTKKTTAAEKEGVALADFEKAVKLLHEKKWKPAQKVFKGIAEAQPRSTIGERARRYVDLCQTRQMSDGSDVDVYLRAIAAKNEGDFETALDLCNRGGLKGRDERFAYLAASIAGLKEDNEGALELLQKAIELNQANRVHAFHDPDFQSLRDDPSSDEIFAVD